MSTIAILPVKSFGAAKQRLGPALGAGSRQALAQAMFSDVLSSLRRVPGVDAVAVVTADPVAEAAALGERVEVLRDTERGGPVGGGADRDPARAGARLRPRSARARRHAADRPRRGGRPAAPRARRRHRRGRSCPTATARAPTRCCSPAGRDRAGLRAGQLRAPRGRRARRPACPARSSPCRRSRWTWTPARTWTCWRPRSTAGAATRRPRAARCASSTARAPRAGRRSRPSPPWTSSARGRSSPCPTCGPATTSPRSSRPPRRPTWPPATCSWSPTRSCRRPRGACASCDVIEPGERALRARRRARQGRPRWCRPCWTSRPSCCAPATAC